MRPRVCQRRNPGWRSTASVSVSTGTTVSPSGMCPTASSQFSSGMTNRVAPASRAPASFCRMPPIGPTVPSGSIVPVPAM